MPVKPLPLLIAGSLSLLLAACPGNPQPAGPGGSETTRIGFIAPLSGVDAAIGVGALNGARLAVEAINAAGGVNGKRLELVPRDDAGTAANGAKVARELADRDVVAIIGPVWSSVAKAVVEEVTRKAGIPTVSPGATAPSLATFDDGGVFFRTIPNDTLQAKALSNLLQEDGHTTVTVLNRDNAYGNDFASALVSFFGTKTGYRATKATYPDSDQPDYPTVKAKWQSGTSAVALIGYTGDAASLLRDWIASNERTDLAWYFSESLRDAGMAQNVTNNPRIEGHKGTFPLADGTYLSDFISAYKDRYGKEPAIYDANAYDAAMLIGLAMVQGQANTSEAVKRHLISVTRDGVKQDGIGREGFSDAVTKIQGGIDIDYDGVSGHTDMDDRGELKGGAYVVWQWRNGQPVDTDKVFRF